MYHEVLPDDVTLPAWTIVRESDFHWQMRYLQRHFDVVSMAQAVERVSGKHEARRPFAVVTFDDGYRGNLHTVLPIMKSMGLPFILYAATQAIIDKSLYWYDQVVSLLDVPEDVQVSLGQQGQQEERFHIPSRAGAERRWQELERLLACLKRMAPAEREAAVRRIADKYDGITSAIEMLSPEELHRLAGSNCVTVGAHTHRHELLDQLQQKEVRHTLHTANEHITRITGYSPRHFSYPNGNFNQQVLGQLRGAGYETAVTTRSGTWSNRDCLLKIPRIGIGRFETMGQFKARVSGCL